MNIYQFNGLMEDLFHQFKKVGPVNPEQVYSTLYFDDEGEPMVEIDCNNGFFFGDEATALKTCQLKELVDDVYPSDLH